MYSVPQLASNAYGAPYAKSAQFCFGRLGRFLLVGKHPKPFESQVPCELRTLRALEFCSRTPMKTMMLC